MKKLFMSMIAACCAAFLFSSCETLDPDNDFSGTPYGFWVVESLTVNASTTINGNTTTHSSTTDFTKDYCRLNLDPVGMGSLWYNWDFDMETFSYDETKARITFKESLNAGDNGKAIVMLGIYEVELDGDRMILRQPEAAIGGSQYGVSEQAIYTLRRAPKNEEPRETSENGE